MRRVKVPLAIVMFAVLFTMAFAQVAASQNLRASLQRGNRRKAAPLFSLSDATGRQVALAAYRGRVLLLNFWATDCGGCRLEIPWIADLYRIFKNENVMVAGISMDVSYASLKNAAEAWSRVTPFVRTHHISYTILMGDGAVETSYGIRALPVTYLIDRKGRMAASYVGLIDEKDVEKNVRILLGER